MSNSNTEGLRVEFYKALGAYRKDGESDLALANRLQIAHTTLNNWKLGRVPNIFHVARVARGLGVPAGELLEKAIVVEPKEQSVN